MSIQVFTDDWNTRKKTVHRAAVNQTDILHSREQAKRLQERDNAKAAKD